MVNRIKRVVRENSVVVKIFVLYAQLFRRKGFVKVLECIKEYVGSDKLKNKKYYVSLAKDVYSSVIENRIIPAEYFLFNFEKRSKEERKKFVGYMERREICTITPQEIWMKFSDKYQAYLLFKKYYNREVIEIGSNQDKSLFWDFCKTHEHFMVKILKGAKGKGIYKIDITPQTDIDSLFSWIIELGICVIEECVIQSSEMARFHTQSVNTVRFVTYVKKHEVKNMFALVRMGCGGNIVDNAGSGGIIAAINMENGKIASCGYRENGECYTKHPDTGLLIPGSQIPQWNNLLELVEKLVEVIPEQPLVGWDLALTDDGWVVIEANHQPSFTGIQMCTQEGIRSMVEEVFGEK